MKKNKSCEDGRNVLLRTMTMKSKIGFGLYPELCVQELIQLKKYRELISMYYKLGKIDFNEEVKEWLHIRYERVITKPGCNHALYNKIIYEMITEIHEFNREFHKDNPNRWSILNENKAQKNIYVKTAVIRNNKKKSKISNRNRNQGRT